MQLDTSLEPTIFWGTLGAKGLTATPGLFALILMGGWCGSWIRRTTPNEEADVHPI